MNMSAKVDLKEAVAQIKAAYLISDYIKQSGVSLTASGAGKWKGLCPFHSEKSPSFTVSDHFQNYHCFGCGQRGDILSFVTQTEHLDFIEALKKLAEDKDISLDFSGDKENSIDYRSIRECLKAAANFFAAEYRKLDADHPARKQVKDRGLSERGMIYGYAPEKRTALYEHLRTLKFSDEIILQAGVATQWKDSQKISDFWSGRLMFIITDITGKPIGFSGRKIFEEDKRGKFVNSPAGPLFDKSSALFNVQNAKQKASESKEVFVAEGQFDVAAFIEAGLPNVVASSGTAFTQNQGSILHRLVGESGKIVFAFDGDAAGEKAALSVFKNVPGIHSVAWVVQFPEGEDPCDYRQSYGNEALVELTKNAVSLVGFVLEVTKKSYDMSSEVGRSQYLSYAARVLSTIASNTLRESFIRTVALDTFTDVDTVKSLVSSATPIELSAIENNIAAEAERPQELSEEASRPTLELIENDQHYALAARFIALAVLDRNLIKYLPKNKSRLPKEFAKTIDELVAYPSDKPIIPEAFSESELIHYFTTASLFPWVGIQTFNTKDQFAYIFKRYMNSVRSSREKQMRAKVYAILNSSTDNEIGLLEEALAKEAKYLEELRVGEKTIPD